MADLHEIFHRKEDECCKCGCKLESWAGVPLGGLFIMDHDGNYYCMKCDDEFKDGDERIYEEVDW